ncbi:MAG TPA: exonuclease domain-containing protein [Bacteroidia bacterium]|nr:exonuclease domain-containing protein [Bacteroidia bacterium]
MYAVIDLETTGGRADKDRITEIAIVLHDGAKRVGEFTSLINPERPIPPYITDITGISDAMVADAPRFYEVARQVVELTDGCIFVAHNVNFDYSFLREEFKRLAYSYEREKICTVRMSRLLMPGLPSYSLGPLCQRLGIPNRARHRAKGDADATVQLLEHLITLQPTLTKVQKPVKDPFAGLPNGIDRKNLSLLPEDPGLYFFHDVGGKVLHVNASRNIRQSALKELQQLGKSVSKASFGPDDLSEVTWELTGNELLALLRLEAEQSRLEPESKAAKTKATAKFGAFSYLDQRGYLRLYVDKLQKGKKAFGEFGTDGDARAALEARIRRHQLCPQLSGLESGTGACSWHSADSDKCSGACLGLENAAAYNARLEAALQGLGLPHPAFFWLGEGRSLDEIAVIGIEQGQLLGFAYLDAAQPWEDPSLVKSLLQPLPTTDAARQTLRQYLAKNKIAKLVPF